MTNLLKALQNRAGQAAKWTTLLALCGGAAFARTPQARITAAISSSSRSTLAGSHPPMARSTNETGRLAGSTTFENVTIGFTRSAAQEIDLQELLTAQQTKGSAEYHKWLTPDEYASRFGMADSDLAKVKTWLTAQGLSVTGVARSKTAISFSGTASQLETAFAIELHTYNVNGESHFAPSTDLQIPVGLSGTVVAVTNLSNFRPHAHVKVKPHFTSSQTGEVFTTPLDVRTIYDVTPIYNAGYTGTGETIVVLGQSAVVTSDITNFQTALGLTSKVPTVTLVPSTGDSKIVTGDEVESDLDLEYSGALAPGATINFIYTGDSSSSSGIFDSLTYAVDQKLGTIISNSYGECEYELGSSNYTYYNNILSEASTQGQTVISASGDDGSTDCYESYGTSNPSLSLTEAQSLQVDFPASSQYVTGIGGTEFPSADAVVGTYWAGTVSGDDLNSAFSYVPETVWNDDSAANGLGAGGGGVSTMTAVPTWQTGVTGIPSSATGRLVPDVSLDASPDDAGYLYCSSDNGTSGTGITGSCTNGLRDSTDTDLTIAGGTSFGAPIFAGITALIDQSQGGTGLGTVNSKLYTLAATRYASVFHDITTGSNACSISSTTYCSTVGASEYAATTGYDEASGLGSINAYNLFTEWSATLAGSATTLTPTTSIPASGASDAIAVTVSAGSSTATATPTGTVTITVDGATSTASTVTLSAGAGTYTFTSSTTGAHLIAATYSGDSVYAGSGWTQMVYVGGTDTTTSSSSGSFTVAATSVTIKAGSSGTSTVTVTPASGYTGTVDWSLTTNDDLADTCYDITDLTVSGTTAVTTSLTFYTNSADCPSTNVKLASGHVLRKIVRKTTASATAKAPATPTERLPLTVALGGVLMLGFFGRKRRSVRLLVAVLALGLAGLGVSGCGSSSSTTTTTGTNQATGSYTITITGTDSSSSSITAATTLTLTVD